VAGTGISAAQIERMEAGNPRIKFQCIVPAGQSGTKRRRANSLTSSRGGVILIPWLQDGETS